MNSTSCIKLCMRLSVCMRVCVLYDVCVSCMIWECVSCMMCHDMSQCVSCIMCHVVYHISRLISHVLYRTTCLYLTRTTCLYLASCGVCVSYVMSCLVFVSCGVCVSYIVSCLYHTWCLGTSRKRLAEKSEAICLYLPAKSQAICCDKYSHAYVLLRSLLRQVEPCLCLRPLRLDVCNL